MLPQIRSKARMAFRYFPRDVKEELIAEVLANAFCAYVRLIERGRGDLAYPTPLADYAIRQVRFGRRVGGQLNIHDVTSRYAQRAAGIAVESLEQFDAEKGEWSELLLEDRRAGPAETAAARIDVAAWFRSLARRKRRMAQALARGEATSRVARIFRLTPGRVSQLRQELKCSWDTFQGVTAAA
jgi:hypothetical protein